MRDTERREELLAAEIAADWLQRLKRGRPDVQAAFASWLRESPRHAREILLATAWQHVLSNMKAHRRVDVDALKEQHRLEASLSLQGRTTRPQLDATTRARPRTRWQLAVAALFVVIASLGIVAWQTVFNQTFSTDFGEWRTTQLADGSALHLGPRTRVSVDITDRERTLRLDRGELMVYVAKDPTRPFFVYTDSVSARAVGTAFAVQQTEPDRVAITVREGRVDVVRRKDESKPGAGPSANATLVLQAGEQTRVTSEDAPLAARVVDVDRELAWVDRRIYVDRTIAEAIREMNMRNRTQIRLMDPAIRDRRVTGVFDAADPVTFARTLEKSLPISLIVDGRGSLLLVPRTKRG